MEIIGGCEGEVRDSFCCSPAWMPMPSLSHRDGLSEAFCFFLHFLSAAVSANFALLKSSEFRCKYFRFVFWFNNKSFCNQCSSICNGILDRREVGIDCCSC